MWTGFDKLSREYPMLDRTAVDSYRNLCEALVVAIRSSMGNKNNNRFTDNKFNEWKSQILKDLQNYTFQPNKQIMVRGINLLLDQLNLTMTPVKSGFVVLRNDVVDGRLDQDTAQDIVENQKNELISNTFTYNNEMSLADFKIENEIADDSLEEDGLIFLVCTILFLNGGKMRLTNLESTMEQFIDLYKTNCGMKKVSFNEYLSSLNSSGYVKLYDGDKDLQELKENGTHIERCIKIGISAISEFSPISIARFIAEIKGISFNKVLKEYSDLNKLIKDDIWDGSLFSSNSTQQISRDSRNQSIYQLSISASSQRSLKRRRDRDEEDEEYDDAEYGYSQRSTRQRTRY